MTVSRLLPVLLAAFVLSACADDPYVFPYGFVPDTADDGGGEADSGDTATETDVEETDTTDADATEPDATEPDATEPDAAEPDATEPDVSLPDADEPDPRSCAFRCGAEFDETALCQCNAECAAFGNCCDDICDVCSIDEIPACDPALLSCEGRCDEPFDPVLPCQCTPDCAEFGNCCDDFGEVCDVGCDPECEGFQSCVDRNCVGNFCRGDGDCDGGICFQNSCRAGSSCSEACAATYGRGTWECVSGGYCRSVECGSGIDCGSGADCVSDSSGNTRGPGGAGLFDHSCVDGRSSACGGSCNGLCSAESGRCSG